MQRFFSFVSGAFCGAVAGSVAVLLLAPLSGRELQHLSRARAEAMVDEVRKAYEERQAELKARLEALKAPRFVP